MVKTLMKSVREYKKDSLITPVLVIGEVVMETLIPVLMANLIDYGIDGGNMNYVVKMGLVLLLSAFASLFLSF